MQHLAAGALPCSSIRGSTVIVCGVSARSARRRQTKLWRKRKRAEKAWQSQTNKEEVVYGVSVPPPDLYVSNAPQFYSPLDSPEGWSDAALLPVQANPGAAVAVPDPGFVAWEPASEYVDDEEAELQHQDTLSQLGSSSPGEVVQPEQGWTYSTSSSGKAGKRRQQQQQQQQQEGVPRPGPVQGPEAPEGALWVERRRSAVEQQEFRQHRAQQRRAATPPRKKPSMAELLATSPQVDELRLEGVPGHRTQQDAPLSSRQQMLQPRQRLPMLSTDLLWERLQTVISAKQ